MRAKHYQHSLQPHTLYTQQHGLHVPLHDEEIHVYMYMHVVTYNYQCMTDVASPSCYIQLF